jgi:hypothetical protein
MVQEVYAPPTPSGGGVAQGPQPVNDAWTAAHEAIRVRMAGRSVLELAEQLAYVFPDEHWGQKRTTGGQWSLDTIGRLVLGRLWAIRVTPSVTIFGVLNSGHVHRVVGGVNHLGVAPAEPGPRVEPPAPVPPVSPAEPAPTDLGLVLAALASQGALIAALHDEVVAVRAQLRNGFDINASSKYLGGITGTVKPKG